MPQSARRGSAKRKPETRPPAKPSAGGTTLAVRMLVGPRAGQVVRVTRDEAVRLCDGWQPQAELVAVNPAESRETR